MWFSRILLIVPPLLAFLSYCSGANTSFVTPSNGKLKILGLFGHLGRSHFDAFQPLVEELARRGHDVTVLSHFPRTEEAKAREPLPNYKDISLKDEKIGVFLNVVNLKRVDQSFTRIHNELGKLVDMANVACEIGLKNPRVKELIRSGEKFDLVLTENFNTDCFLVIIHKLNATFMSLSSHQIMPWGNSLLGNPQEVSYMPTIFTGLPRPMKFIERLTNALTTAYASYYYDTVFHSAGQAIAEEVYGPGIPDLREISRNAKALIINTHHSLHGSRPHLPNVIEAGGLHIPTKTKPLPREIAEFLDKAPEGALYFNLGSMVKASSMPTETLEMILRVIASIPRKVIWKWEAESLPSNPSNLLVMKWMPQFDILGHPNVKCYLGHGGLLGLSEGIYHGVPMVLVPVFGDQFHNAAAAKTRGVAEVIWYKDLNEQALRAALDNVFNTTRYRENARKLSKAYRDRPASPLETAVWWTEYIARGNGLPYLKSEGANMPWYQRLLFDVALFLLAVALVILFVVYRVVKLLLAKFRASGKTKSLANGRTPKKED